MSAGLSTPLVAAMILIVLRACLFAGVLGTVLCAHTAAALSIQAAFGPLHSLLEAVRCIMDLLKLTLRCQQHHIHS